MQRDICGMYAHEIYTYNNYYNGMCLCDYVAVSLKKMNLQFFSKCQKTWPKRVVIRIMLCIVSFIIYLV